MYCTNCGAENLDEAKFCQECGNEIQSSENNNLNENLVHQLRIDKFSGYNNEKNLIKHMKNRLGTNLRPSKEVKSFFGAGSLPSFDRQRAAMFASTTSIGIKKGIKSGEIKTVDEIDNIIDNAYKKRKARMEKARIDKEAESIPKPTYKVIHFPKKIAKTYQKTSDLKKLRRAGNVIGGGILFGSVGALAGYALSDTPDTETKTKFIQKKYIQKDCIIRIHENKFDFTNKKANWHIFYEKISSMHLNKDKSQFEVFENNGSKLIFIGEKNTTSEYTEQIFDKIKSKFTEYNQNHPQKITKPIQNKSEEQPIELLKKLQELKESGIIDEIEFKEKKKELLQRI